MKQDIPCETNEEKKHKLFAPVGEEQKQASNFNLKVGKLLPWQEEVIQSPARFKVLCVGRRAGKTVLGALIANLAAFQGKKVLWASRSTKNMNDAWKELQKIAKQINRQFIVKTQFIEGGGHDCLRSKEYPNRDIDYFAHDGCINARDVRFPDNLRGSEYDLIIIDEAAYIDREVWTAVLRPTIMGINGKAIFMSTPNAKNWFYELYLFGQDTDMKDWQSWQLPCTVNPSVTEDELKGIKRELSSASEFKREYMAEFVDGGEAVFTKVRENAIATPQISPEQGHVYYMGIDWGNRKDYTVVSIIDNTNPMIPELVYMDRFNQTSWEYQLKQVKEAVRIFKPSRILGEENSIGEVLLETLQKNGVPVEPFCTTNMSKQKIIQQLRFHLETNTIKLLDDFHLLKELEIYIEDRTPRKNYVTYNAPTGGHDDCVMSLAIALEATKYKEFKIASVPSNFRSLIGV